MARWALAGSAVVVVALAAGALAGRLTSSALFPSTEPAPAAAEASAPGLVRFFRDGDAGLSLSYPADWTRHQSRERGVKLIASKGREASLLVRTVKLGFEVEPAEVPAARALTERFVARGRGVDVLATPRQITLGGLPGWWWLYAFDDAGTGARGVHSHYFLFDGERMVVLVFQAAPAERFERFAAAFDRIAASFRAG